MAHCSDCGLEWKQDESLPCPGCGRLPAAGDDDDAADADAATIVTQRPLEATARTAVGTRRCPACSATAPRDWHFCKACGGALGVRGVATEGEQPGASQRHVLEVVVAPRGARRGAHAITGTHVIGREPGAGGVALAADASLSARHASVRVHRNRCFVSDLASTNGTFASVRGTETLFPGAVLRLGQQRLLFRVGPRGPLLIHVLPGGREGRTFRIQQQPLLIGKEDVPLSFPADTFLSRTHAEVRLGQTGEAVVRDLGSLNGTYLLLRGERELTDGDRVLVGEHVLRYGRTPN